MSTPTAHNEPDVISQKLFLLIVGGAVVFLGGVITVLTLMPGK
ncbi:MAG: hypothetical protein QM817_38920 [Archangium sp.]